MSAYTCFRKGGIDLCSFGRSATINEGLNPPYGEWQEVTEQDLNLGIEKLKENIEFYKNRANDLKETLNYLKEKQDILDTISDIREYEEEIENNMWAKAQLYLLIDILNEKTYNSETETETEYKMEWGQF